VSCGMRLSIVFSISSIFTLQQHTFLQDLSDQAHPSEQRRTSQSSVTDVRGFVGGLGCTVVCC